MKGRLIALDHVGEREAAALMLDGQVEDLFFETDQPAPGTIYRAIVERPMKGQGGMFLRTPDGSAFVRQVKGLAPGQTLLVQVTGYAEPGKAIPVTAKVLFKSRYAIVTPDAPGINVSRRIKDDDMRESLLEIAHEIMDADGFGLILRSSCEGADADEIADDIAAMADLAAKVMADAQGDAEVLVEGDGPHLLAWREWTDKAEIDSADGSFERHGVLDVLDGLQARDVPLGGHASMAIEPTRALVAVDVNTGGDTSPAAGLKANLAAVKDLPRQLRLRGLGGQIVIDPAPTAKKDRRQIESALRSALKRDSVETVFVGWTPLGHIELQRKRDRLSLSEVLT
ncbi:ribonuclease E/G [Marivita geojedonensis]|uniref:Ribonuclease G n=1 Tax=Marivita geojedonensis TaxID=1123756 RepID=A0A1X4NAW2_9RHOB|nr:ribonuclease E/G [Marivita geojedonensis]OSQ43578.1 ribonuclease G [Marivita geojedonensis]PRY73781.1 Rne/Rng family ribonuclease [Marivita geojedonensis]